jgi:hypothetical protein
VAARVRRNRIASCPCARRTPWIGEQRSHRSATTAFAGLCSVPCRGCHTCHMCCLLEEAVCGRMDHRIVCDHQVFVQQHHQHVTTHQGCSPCACPKRLHGTLDGHCNPSTLANEVLISKEQAVACRHALCVGGADHFGRWGAAGREALGVTRTWVVRAEGKEICRV